MCEFAYIDTSEHVTACVNASYRCVALWRRCEGWERGVLQRVAVSCSALHCVLRASDVHPDVRSYLTKVQYVCTHIAATHTHVNTYIHSSLHIHTNVLAFNSTRTCIRILTLKYLG